MLIYQGTSQEFVTDVRENRIADIMSNSFKMRWGTTVGRSEFTSWQNSLSRVRDLIEVGKLNNTMIALEYEVPYNQNRIDCLIFGKGYDKAENIVLIELKQWSEVIPMEDEGNFVETYTGGNTKVVPHPAQQVKGYHEYLKSFVQAFESPVPPLTLFSCSYCHNYKREDSSGLFDPIYQKIVGEFPVYCKEDVKELGNKLKGLLAEGDGFEVFNRFMQSPITPSKKLLENASKMISNEAIFSLLNEQLVAKNLIWSKVRKGTKAKKKSVIIVHGGPGTGKSLIALNVLAEAATKGMRKIFYGCKSKPFTFGLKYLVGEDAEKLISNLYRFVPSRIKENDLDLLLIDEAHRIEKTSNFQYTKMEDRTEMPQMEQLIRCAKTSVFFIDDRQNVRSQEIGSTDLIKHFAAQYKCEVSEVNLLTQFRCMGSNDYMEWIESTLGFSDADKTLSKDEAFEFKIIESPQKLYDTLKAIETKKANSARLVAGYCWNWSDPNPDGTLVDDVVIGSFKMPWEAKEGKRVAQGIPRWYEWAYKTNGINQVGCIYTAQGFEFDYIGVIIADDLAFDKKANKIIGNPSATSDPTLRRGISDFDVYVKNIYRVLMSRGMKGCYVYFTNKEVEKYFRSKIE
jgi:DUF2075 family protein